MITGNHIEQGKLRIYWGENAIGNEHHPGSYIHEPNAL